MLLHDVLYDERVVNVPPTLKSYIAILSAGDYIAILSIVDDSVIPATEDCFMMRLFTSVILFNV